MNTLHKIVPSIITQQEQDMIYISQVCTHRQGKIVKFKASQLWNELLTQLKTIRSSNTFKYQLKSYLINEIN